GIERRLRNGSKEPVDQEYDVEWQPRFGEFGRTAHINEHADDVMLLADVHATTLAQQFCIHRRRQDRDDADVRVRPKLARKTDRRIGGDTDAIEHMGLASRWWWQGADITKHPNAAGRATRAAAAHAGMRDAVTQTGFENAYALRHSDLPVRKRNRNHATAALPQGAHAACRENECDRRCIAKREIDKDNTLDHPRLWSGHALQVLLAPLGVVGELGDFAPAVVCTDHRQRRQQNGNGEKIWRRPIKE